MDQDTCEFFHHGFSKQHEMKINEGVLKIITREKNATSNLKNHCIKRDDIPLVVIRFFFSNTNLVFKSNLLFIGPLDNFCHSLFSFSPFDFYFLRILKFIQCLYAFFIKTSNVLRRFNVLFVWFSSSKCYVLFFMKNSYLLRRNCC